MVIKFIGGILALFSGTLIGIYYSNRVSFRMDELKEIKRAISMLRSEIEYMSSALPEAAQNIAAKSTGNVSALFSLFCDYMNGRGETAYTAWKKSIEAAFQNSYLSSEDIQNLDSLGLMLGYIDRKLQLSSMDMLVDYIDLTCAELSVMSKNNKKLYTSLGIMSGLAVCIVLI